MQAVLGWRWKLRECSLALQSICDSIWKNVRVGEIEDKFHAADKDRLKQNTVWVQRLEAVKIWYY